VNSWGHVRVVVTVKIGEPWVFTSEPMTAMWGDILLRLLADGPFEVLKAHLVPAEDEALRLGFVDALR